MKGFSLYFSSLAFTGVRLKRFINYHCIANVLLYMLFWIFNQRFSTLLMIRDISDYAMIGGYVTVSEVPVNRLFVFRTKF